MFFSLDCPVDEVVKTNLIRDTMSVVLGGSESSSGGFEQIYPFSECNRVKNNKVNSNKDYAVRTCVNTAVKEIKSIQENINTSCKLESELGRDLASRDPQCFFSCVPSVHLFDIRPFNFFASLNTSKPEKSNHVPSSSRTRPVRVPKAK